VTLGTDCEGRLVLIEQAREDAQSLFVAHASRTPVQSQGPSTAPATAGCQLTVVAKE